MSSGNSIMCRIQWADGNTFGHVDATTADGSLHLVGTVQLTAAFLRKITQVSTVVSSELRRIEFTMPAPAPTVVEAGLTGGSR